MLNYNKFIIIVENGCAAHIFVKNTIHLFDGKI